MINYYPFELHTHTIHSDGSYSERELVERVANHGLMGFSLTDHNTYSGCQLTEECAKKKNLLFLPGLEWTTFYGHITIISTGDFNDYREINPLTIQPILRKAKEEGGLSFLAHPFRVGSPVCTGCNDEFGIEDYSSFHGFEVWSGENPNDSFANIMAERKYESICDEGVKLAAVYGRDWHADSKPGTLFAATYVGIDGNASSHTFFEGLKARRTYISLGLRSSIELISEKGEVHDIGCLLPPGNYTLSVKLFPEKDFFFNGEKIFPTSIELKGRSLAQSRHSIISYGLHLEKLELNEGYLQIKIMGKIGDSSSVLLIATPFFVSKTNSND